MKKTFFAFVCFLLLFQSVSAGEKKVSVEDIAKQQLKNRPVRFTENKGQMTDSNGNPVPFVLFKAEANGITVYITEKGLTYVFLKSKKNENVHSKKLLDFHKTKESNFQLVNGSDDEEVEIVTWERIDMNILNATIKKENILKDGISNDFSQYFLPHCPNGITDVHSYEKITIKNVYPDIDWVLYNTQENGFKYDFIVHPGADPELIKLVYSSINPLKIRGNGEIKIKTSAGELKELSPYSYIKENGQKVESEFQIISQKKQRDHFESSINFKLSSWKTNNTQTLVIDPQLVWGTFFSGDAFVGPAAIDCDGAGNLFMVGATEQTNLPTLNPGGGTYFQGTLTSGTEEDMCVTKFTNAGVILWSTYYGGSGNDGGACLEVDKDNNIVVGGHSVSTDFPVFDPGSGAYFQSANAGYFDSFILKFTNSGVRLWATYMGNPGPDGLTELTTDTNGNIFVTGDAESGFPIQTLSGAYNSATPNGLNSIFITKFSGSGVLLWSTFFGGSGDNASSSIIVDNAGNLLLTGYTTSVDFPIQNLAGAYNQASNAGKSDAVIFKFDPGGALLWSTYFGGPGKDYGLSIDVDVTDNIFLVGTTDTVNFPTVNPGNGAFFQGNYAGTTHYGMEKDLFVSKFNNAGLLVWSTYYGGDGIVGEGLPDGNDGLQIDNCGNAYLGFMTTSPDITTLDPGDGSYYRSTQYLANNFDGFIVKFSNSGNLLWATYWGGDRSDQIAALTLDMNNNLFLTAITTQYGSGAPILPPLMNSGGGVYYNSTPSYTVLSVANGRFISKFINSILTITTTEVNAACGCIGKDSVVANGGTPPYSYQWSNGQTAQVATGLCAGNYTVTVSDASCSSQTQAVTIASASSLNVATTATPVSCSGGANSGSAVATPNGGVAPYIYSWAPSGGTDSIASGLSQGTYTVTVTDASGCSMIDSAVVTGSSINIAVNITNCTNCTANGTITATPSGGVPPYTYLWSNGQTAQTAITLLPGTYTVVATDANSCSQTQTATVTGVVSNISLAVSVTSAICISSGTATATPTGGTSPYNYLWSNGQTTQTASGLVPGTDTIIVTDANGCSQMQTAVVTDSISTIVLAETSTNANCTANGTASVVPIGGTLPYTYLWGNGQTTQTATGLAPGTDTVIVTDSNGCIQTQMVTIAGYIANMVLAITTTNASCISNGTATVIPTGGTAPYSYLWSNGQTVQTATNLSAGTDTVIVTDFNGCSQTQIAVVSDSIPTIILSISSVNAECSVSGSATVTAIGGTAPYIYSWSNGQTLQTATGLLTGTYFVTVTDTNGCSQNQSVSITGFSDPIATVSAQPSMVIVGSSSQLTASGGAFYSWSPQNGLSCIDCQNPISFPSSTIDYCVTVIDTNGCTDSACITITVEMPCGKIEVPTAFSPNDDGHNDSFILHGFESCVSSFSLQLFDRWGEKVAETENPSVNWDGTFKGKPLNPGVFVYYMNATLINGEKITKKGNISLIR